VNRNWNSIIETLRANPGRWALIEQGATLGAVQSIQNTVNRRNEGDLELITRRNPSGVGLDAYLRSNP
jgi:hypothetical protein